MHSISVSSIASFKVRNRNRYPTMSRGIFLGFKFQNFRSLRFSRSTKTMKEDHLRRGIRICCFSGVGTPLAFSNSVVVIYFDYLFWVVNRFLMNKAPLIRLHSTCTSVSFFNGWNLALYAVNSKCILCRKNGSLISNYFQ